MAKPENRKMHWAKESEKPPSLTFQIRLRVVQKEGGRWEFRFCGFGEFLVRFLVFAFKIAVFRFWCSVRFAGFLQLCLVFGFCQLTAFTYTLFLKLHIVRDVSNDSPLYNTNVNLR